MNIHQSNVDIYTHDKNDIAKTTIKETTIDNNYTGPLQHDINKELSHIASNNMNIDDKKETSIYNRPANAKGDLYGPYIDENNVRLNEPILYSYVSHPYKNLDHSTMPTKNTNVYLNKPIIESSSYYINSNFINTLKTNPLVNDIYHQKNV